jgi:N-acetylglucosaminyl-diphospho-decaprenol L-rhamnosyltransferase
MAVARRRPILPRVGIVDADLAVIIVSANSRHWLEECLQSVYRRAGTLRLDVIVVDSGCTDDTRPFVEERFPQARVLSVANRGFAAANNAGLASTRAAFVLFLNPDTEIVRGTLRELVDAVVERRSVGLVGVRQVGADGELQLTIRRFPSVTRTLFEALGSERWPLRASWVGERELRPTAYDSETVCDWTVGSFMLARREAIDAAGFMDERFFLYLEEPDLCRRIWQAGWEVRHLPLVTVVHYGGEREQSPELKAQEALSRRLYMRKYFSRPRYVAGGAALALGYGLRTALGRPGVPDGRRATARAAATLLGLAPPPFGEPPDQSVASRPWRSPETARAPSEQ